MDIQVCAQIPVPQSLRQHLERRAHLGHNESWTWIRAQCQYSHRSWSLNTSFFNRIFCDCGVYCDNFNFINFTTEMAVIAYPTLTLTLPFLVTLVTLSAGLTAYTGTDRCTIYQGACAYHVIVTGKDCVMAGDSPMASPYRSPRELDNNHIDTVPAEEEKSDASLPVKKLEELERKLVKMMEGLSIRSLRHIRQIKNNLRRMTNTIDHLDKAGKGGKTKFECPNEFVGVGTWRSCYRFSTFNATWHEAREYCSAFGAELVSLDTMKEAYILDYLIKSNPGKF